MAWGPLTPRHAQDSSLDSLFARTVSPDILLPWDKVLFEGLSVPPWHCQRSRAGVCSHGVRIWGQFSHSPDLTGTVLLCSPPSPSAGSWSHGCPGGGVSIGEPNATTDPHRLVANPKAVRQGGRWAHASPFLPPAWLGPAGHPGRCHLRSPFARTVSPITGQTNKQASLTSFRFLPGHPGTAAGGDHGAEGSEVAGGRGARSPGAELIPPAAGQEAPSRHGPTGHLIPPPPPPRPGRPGINP